MNNNGDVGRLSNFSLAPKPSITDHYRVLIYNPVRAAKIRDQLSLLYHTTRKSVCLTSSCKRILEIFDTYLLFTNSLPSI